MVQKFIGRLILKVLGWEICGSVPTEKKYIVVAAPHTSNWDLVMGKIYTWAVGIKLNILIKKEAFFFPLNLLLKYWGGIPLNREKTTNIVDQLAELFKQRERLILVIAPEGTRSKVYKWKTGFYRIAQKAQVPIILSFADFKKKQVGILRRFDPTGNMERDIEKIKSFYKDITPMYPRKYIDEEGKE